MRTFFVCRKTHLLRFIRHGVLAQPRQPDTRSSQLIVRHYKFSMILLFLIESLTTVLLAERKRQVGPAVSVRHEQRRLRGIVAEKRSQLDSQAGLLHEACEARVSDEDSCLVTSAGVRSWRHLTLTVVAVLTRFVMASREASSGEAELKYTATAAIASRLRPDRSQRCLPLPAEECALDSP